MSGNIEIFNNQYSLEQVFLKLDLESYFNASSVNKQFYAISGTDPVVQHFHSICQTILGTIDQTEKRIKTWYEQTLSLPANLSAFPHELQHYVLDDFEAYTLVKNQHTRFIEAIGGGVGITRIRRIRDVLQEKLPSQQRFCQLKN